MNQLQLEKPKLDLQKQLKKMKSNISAVNDKLEIVKSYYIEQKKLVETFAIIDNTIYEWLKNNSGHNNKV